MKPVYQQNDNDCLPACIASLLELPLELVPNFYHLSADKQTAMTQKWLQKIGWTLLDIPLDRSGAVPWRIMAAPCYGILSIEYRATGLHAVVCIVDGTDYEIVFDPAPDSLLGTDYSPRFLSFLVPAIKPEKRKRK